MPPVEYTLLEGNCSNGNSYPVERLVLVQYLQYSSRRLLQLLCILTLMCILAYTIADLRRNYTLHNKYQLPDTKLRKTLSKKDTTKKPYVSQSHKIISYSQKNPVRFTTTKVPSTTIQIRNHDDGVTSTSGYSQEKSSDDKACNIPVLDPFDKSIKHLIDTKDVKAPMCLKQYPLVFEQGLNSTLVRIWNSTKDWTSCCYKIIVRSQDFNDSRVDSDHSLSEKCYPLSETHTKIPPEHEFIAVHCVPPKNWTTPGSNKTNLNLTVIDVFTFTPLKKEVEERILKFEKITDLDEESRVNLVVLGIDAVSHMNFQRIMPKVHKHLVNNLSAIGMDGYVKIGDNTFPNILAALTSWNTTEAHKRCEKDKFFDDCPFVWKNVSAKGYRTSYGEDAPWMGIFNYVKRGFRRPPVDYYIRPATHYADKNVASDHRGNANICYGPRMAFDVLLNHMKRLATMMGNDKRYFQFMWATSLTHDYLNQGALGEESLLAALYWFQTQGHMNKTVFVLMSDHGVRWGEIRKLRQGKIEESMPFIYFVIPEWLKKKYPRAMKNMERNRHRLTNPYDTYETFIDILNVDRLQSNSLKKREEAAGMETSRGISMFLPIPKERTCEMANIPSHYCVCHEATNLPEESVLARQAANYAVFKLNSFVSKFKQCAYLGLSKVTRAQLIHSKADMSRNETERVVEISFVTKPGDAAFDGTLERDGKGNWKLSGEFSRINLYGNQSYCVDNKEMKKYCSCLDSVANEV